jgi:Caudovirus prohead serine protease
MSTTGNALAIRLKLRTLMQRHRTLTTPVTIPLHDPSPHDMVLCGFASTDDLDLDRVKMRPYAFGYPLRRQYRDVPLLYKHDAKQVAGKIEDLEYDDCGNLCVWAVVTHEPAKRCGAFSIRAVVNEYEIKDADSQNFYAIINSAELTEISLTDNPSNPHALVMDRYRVSPQVQFLGLLGEKVKRLQQLAALIKQEIRT